ncbi:hypothetical protein YC2023_056653 [Brassica napus]
MMMIHYMQMLRLLLECPSVERNKTFLLRDPAGSSRELLVSPPKLSAKLDFPPPSHPANPRESPNAAAGYPCEPASGRCPGPVSSLH